MISQLFVGLYAELESEVSDYLINDVQNGFSGTKVVNFNNGIPDQEQQLSIKCRCSSQVIGGWWLLVFASITILQMYNIRLLNLVQMYLQVLQSTFITQVAIRILASTTRIFEVPVVNAVQLYFSCAYTVSCTVLNLVCHTRRVDVRQYQQYPVGIVNLVVTWHLKVHVPVLLLIN